MKRRETDAPGKSPDPRDDRAQGAGRAIPRRYLCGHLHESRDEALRCAKKLATRISSKPVPPDYYLG